MGGLVIFFLIMAAEPYAVSIYPSLKSSMLFLNLKMGADALAMFGGFMLAFPIMTAPADWESAKQKKSLATRAVMFCVLALIMLVVMFLLKSSQYETWVKYATILISWIGWSSSFMLLK